MYNLPKQCMSYVTINILRFYFKHKTLKPYGRKFKYWLPASVILLL